MDLMLETESDTTEIVTHEFCTSCRTKIIDSEDYSSVQEARFFKVSRDLLCIADFNGFFLHLNPIWTAKLGWSLHQLKSRPFIEFVHPNDVESTLLEVSALAQGRETISFENRYRHLDGSYRWLRWNAYAIPNQGHIYTTARDVTRQRELEQQILTISDREKQNLGRELHDGVCQTLAGLSALSSTLAKRLLSSDNSDCSELATEISSSLRDAITQIRDVARDLYSPEIHNHRFEDSLQTIATNTEALFGMPCRADCDRNFPVLTDDVKHQLHRIVQESVNNALTHANAQSIGLKLTKQEISGVLEIRDDGVGIDPSHLTSDGIGLQTMNYRARFIGATLTVRPGQNGGTVVLCCFPLPVTT